jgi:outer membrane protein W
MRGELNYLEINLNHLSKLAERASLGGLQLQSTEGNAKVFEAGMHLECYPWSIRKFQERQSKILPYFGLGAHYVSYRPEAYSTLGPLNYSATTFPTFLNRINTSQGSAFALIGDIGMRFRVGPFSNLLISSKRHFSVNDNYEDDLNPQNVNNRANDSV